MAEVRLQEVETLENALRRFKRKVLTEEIIKEVKRHAFYLKPGQKRRVKGNWLAVDDQRRTVTAHEIKQEDLIFPDPESQR